MNKEALKSVLKFWTVILVAIGYLAGTILLSATLNNPLPIVLGLGVPVLVTAFIVVTKEVYQESIRKQRRDCGLAAMSEEEFLKRMNKK